MNTAPTPNPQSGTQGKIVHYLYEPGDGGLDRVAILLANKMVELGLDCELWMARADGPAASLVSDQLPVRIIDTVSFGSRGLRLFAQIPALARAISSHKPAMMFSAGNQSNLSLALAKKLSSNHSTAIIQKVTNPIIRPGMGRVLQTLRRWRFGLTAHFASCVLLLSEADRAQFAQFYPSQADKFAAVKNAYVTPAMLEIGKSRKMLSSKEVPQLLAAGRLAVQKDYATMLSALGELKHLPWFLTILGDGPLMEQAKTQAQELGIIDRILFKGFVKDPLSYFAKSDLFLSSSRWEGLPAAPFEAVASGCDLVVTDCSQGLSDILGAHDIICTPVGDAPALAGSIANALQAPEPNQALQIIAQDYSIASSVQDHLRIASAFTA